MIKKIKKSFFCLSSLFWLLSTKVALALTTQEAQPTEARERLQGISQQAGYTTTNPGSVQNIIISIILYALGLLGLIFLSFILIAGFQWMTAGGNEDKITGAKNKLKNAVIGFAIVVAAYMITTFLASMFSQSTTQTFYGWGTGTNP